MYYYIVNPAANHGTINSIQDRLKTTLLRLNIDGEFAKTIGEGDATRITHSAINKGFKTIVAVGGDGTVNEVVTAAHKAKKPNVAIGIVPIGKQNTLAHHLDIKDWQQACKVLSARRLQSYSLMKIDDHVFIYSAVAAAASPKQSSQTRTDFKYLLDIDGGFRVRGVAGSVNVYNQKFLRPELDNQLVVHVHPARQQPSIGLVRNLLNRMRASQTWQPAFSQIHGQAVTLQAQTAADMLIDGAPIEGRRWEIKLSDNHVQLITNRPPAKGL